MKPRLKPAYPKGLPCGLQDNFTRMVGLLESGNLSEETFRQLRKSIEAQIDSAEKLALNACPDSQPDLFMRARQVLGFGADPALDLRTTIKKSALRLVKTTFSEGGDRG